MSDREKFGATGDFPDGAINDNDQGGLQFGVAADPRNQTVLVDFGKPVQWIGMPPKTARQFAKSLMDKANQLDGGIGA